MENVFEATVKNELNGLSLLIEGVTGFLKPHDLAAKVVNAVDLVLEEAINNIIRYGYDDQSTHTIDIRLEVSHDEIAVRLEDDGRPFNPLTVPRLDKSKPAPERIDDGLGIHLVRNIMRSMTYQRVEDKNIFEIWIKK